jgi:hypothetical protein
MTSSGAFPAGVWDTNFADTRTAMVPWGELIRATGIAAE